MQKDPLSPSMTDFEILAEKALSRRRFLQIGGALAAGAAGPVIAGSRLGFEAVAANTLDTITLPKGYGWHVVASWGDPLWSDAPTFDQETRGTGASQEPRSARWATTTTAWSSSMPMDGMS